MRLKQTKTETKRSFIHAFGMGYFRLIGFVAGTGRISGFSVSLCEKRMDFISCSVYGIAIGKSINGAFVHFISGSGDE
jgi:hypothetical protein